MFDFQTMTLNMIWFEMREYTNNIYICVRTHACGKIKINNAKTSNILSLERLKIIDGCDMQ